MAEDGFDFDEKLALIYNLSALRQVFDRRLNAPEWGEYRQIIEKHAEARGREGRDYEANYQTRFGEELRNLINEYGRNGYDFTYDMAGKNAFDSERLNREAEKRVRRNHEGTLDAIDRSEHDRLQELYDHASTRQDQRGVARDAFDRARDPENAHPSGPRRSFD